MGKHKIPLGYALITCFVMIALFIVPEDCIAAGGGDASHSWAEFKDLLSRIMNFAVMAAIIGVVFYKANLKKFFSSRKETIETDLENLKQKKADAEIQYNAIEDQLKKLEEEKEAIILKFQKEGEAIRDHIIAEANEKAGKIIAQADETIKRELRSSYEQLRVEIVEAIMKEAETIISSDIKAKDEDKLLEEFIVQVEKLH